MRWIWRKLKSLPKKPKLLLTMLCIVVGLFCGFVGAKSSGTNGPILALFFGTLIISSIVYTDLRDRQGKVNRFLVTLITVFVILWMIEASAAYIGSAFA